MKAQQETADFQYRTKAIDKKIDVKEVVDNTFIKKALKQNPPEVINDESRGCRLAAENECGSGAKKPGRMKYGWMKGLLLPAVIIAIWQIIGGLGVVSATVLPTPVAIVLTFKELILSGELFGHLQISIYRAALGFCLARGLA